MDESSHNAGGFLTRQNGCRAGLVKTRARSPLVSLRALTGDLANANANNGHRDQRSTSLRDVHRMRLRCPGRQLTISTDDVGAVPLRNRHRGPAVSRRRAALSSASSPTRGWPSSRAVPGSRSSWRGNAKEHNGNIRDRGHNGLHQLAVSGPCLRMEPDVPASKCRSWSHERIPVQQNVTWQQRGQRLNNRRLDPGRQEQP